MNRWIAVTVLVLCVTGGLVVAGIGQDAEVASWTLPGADSMPMGIDLAEDGRVFFSEFNVDRIGELDPSTNTLREWDVGGGPNGLAVTPHGIFHTLAIDNAIGTLLPSVSVVWNWSVPSAASWPERLLATAGLGVVNLWFNERSASKVGLYAPTALALPTYLGVSPTPVLVIPSTVRLTPSRTSVVANTIQGNPMLPPPIYLAGATLVGDFAEWTPMTSEPVEDLTMAPDGRVWFCQGLAPLGSLDPSSGSVLAYGMPTGTTTSCVVASIVNEIWFGETSRPAIGRLDPVSGDVTLWTIPAGSQPYEIAIGPYDRVWFTDRSADLIGYLEPSTNDIVTYRLPLDTHPLDLAIDDLGQVWFTSERRNHVSRLTLAPVLGPPPVVPGTMGFTAYRLSQAFNRAEVALSYFYDGSMGFPVWLDVQVLADGSPLPDFDVTTVRVDTAGAGSSALAVTYEGAVQATSDAICLCISSFPGGPVLFSEEIAFAATWWP